jgi:Domain of unknown function (DUF4845)
MTHRTLHSQKGLGFMSLIFWVALGGSILLVGLKTMPIVSEYAAIKKAVAIAAATGNGSPAGIRSSFDQQSKANYVDNFSGRDLQVENVNGMTTVTFAYQRTIPLAGPVSLLFDFSGKELAK